ncbi:LytTR family DNA-binding domain-containing protein [Lachnospiraceae bacterium 54-53]
MQTVIIDDEKNSIEYLEGILKKQDEFIVVASFSNSKEGFSYLLKQPCEVLFLDIDMPEINGIYIAEQISSLYPDIRICFVTAHNAYAVKAFELNAVDYLLKPFTEERLNRCLDKLRSSRSSHKALQEISDNYQYNLDMVCGFHDDNIMLISSSDIFYIEVLQSVCIIHTRDKTYRGNKTLNFYEEKLKKKFFFRTHKCYLANLSKVDRFCPRINYTYDMYFKEIPDVILLSRNKVKELKQYFNF